MKIALAQLNQTVGDLDGNQKKIIEAITKAKEMSVEIILFSELSLIGYPPEDLLLLPHFVDDVESKLLQIVEATKGITAVVGTVRKNPSNTGKALFNSAAIIKDGKLLGFYDKILLPTYNIFDERRYFEPGSKVKIWDIQGKKVAITICEDLWNVQVDSRYRHDLVAEMRSQKPDLMLNLSASPFCKGHLDDRLYIAALTAKEVNSPLFYCNQVGANDSLIFDGYSLFFDEQGTLMDMAKGFKEDLFVVEYPSTKPAKKIENNMLQDVYQALVLGVRDYFCKSGFKQTVLGLSGGIDSALVACIAKEALGAKNVTAIAMPSRFSSSDSITDAKTLAQNLKINFQEISIEKPFSSYLDILGASLEGKDFDTTEENLQARIRGMILMAISNKFGSIVLSTGNKSEMALGYCTLYGDMCGGLAVLSDVTKSDVYALSKWINREHEIIPWNTINKPPSAELKSNQTDQDTLPSYEIIDNVLTSYLENEFSGTEIAQNFGYDLNVVEDLIKRIHQNEYKRKQAPPGLRISKNAFTVGRRFPIVQKWI